MDAEKKYQIFQIKPGKAIPLAIDPDDPKDIKRIQAILAKAKTKAETAQ